MAQPDHVVYEPLDSDKITFAGDAPVTVVTLSRFTHPDFGPDALPHWKMSGGGNTELVPFVITGSFQGTRAGKVYRKRLAG